MSRVRDSRAFLLLVAAFLVFDASCQRKSPPPAAKRPKGPVAAQMNTPMPLPPTPTPRPGQPTRPPEPAC